MSARSVSQCLLPNLSKGITWCLPGSAQCLSSQRLSNGLDQCLSELALTCLFCQCLWWEPCWCLSGLDSPVFLPMSLLVNSIDVCLKFFWRLLPNLSVFLPMSFQEEPADVCLDWARVSPCQYLSSELNRCQICLSFCQYLFRKSLLMSAWIELACLLASIFLVSSIDVCLKCFPLLVCQCLSSGSLGFLLRRASRRFSRLLPSVSEQSYSQGLRSFCHSVSLVCLNVSLVSDGVGIQSSSVSGGCQLDVFPWVFQDSVSKPIRSSSGLLLQDLSNLLLVLLPHNFLSRLYKLPTCK